MSGGVRCSIIHIHRTLKHFDGDKNRYAMNNPTISPTPALPTMENPSFFFASYHQRFEVGNNVRIFDEDEVKLLEGQFETYTAMFGDWSAVVGRRINTLCSVTLRRQRFQRS